jgi:hypothetical protein
MLKDLIKNFYINKLSASRGEDPLFKNIRGEVEIIGTRNGKVFHYEKGDNTVTMWAKHSVMHSLSGENFCNYGRLRSSAITDHSIYTSIGDSGLNTDGFEISGEQHFTNAAFPGTNGWWSQANAGLGGSFIYPFFPTKMLFGTGKEWQNWTQIGDSAYWSYYISAAGGSWDTSTFDNYVLDAGAYGGTNVVNEYSNAYDTVGDSVPRKRTMNDIYSSLLVTPVIQDTDYGITGAVKDGGYRYTRGDSVKLNLVGGNYFLKNALQGIGKPSFVYARRESRFFQAGTEIALDWDSTVENKITYTVTLPEQTGINAGKFYPYNGYVLKVAGLFCDARFVLRGDAPADNAHSDDSALQEYRNYNKMPFGMLMAKRYIAPITKTHDVSITCRWTIYI